VATCCFCGRGGKQSREHVWPRWLRKWPAYEEGLRQFGTAQAVRQEPVSSLGLDGRIEASMAGVRKESQYLPFVTVPVCARCNNGWMSQMEQGTKRVLTPLIEARPHEVNVPDQLLLAVWALKCLYAYASVYHPQNLPFSREEYAELRERRQPPDRCAVWLGRAESDFARVAMGVEPALIADPTDGSGDLHSRAANTAQGYLAAHGIVFIVHWLPEPMPDLYDLLFPNTYRAGLTRISNPREPLLWPTGLLLEQMLTTQRTTFLTTLNEISLPLEGQTEGEAAVLYQRYLAGENPRDLRRSAGRTVD
jgi:hypothetical protein